MDPKPQVVVTEFRGHPLFQIEVAGNARFRFGKTKATCLVDNWSKVKRFVETGDGNDNYKGYDVLKLDLGRGRFFRFGRYKATLCVKVENELHEFAGASRTELQRRTSVPPGVATPAGGNLSLSQGDASEDCLLLAVHVAFADEQVLDVEIQEIKERFLGGPGSSELLSEFLSQVETGQSALQDLIRRLRSRLTVDERQLVLERLFDIAAADRLFHEGEREMLTVIHEGFGTDPEHFDRMLRLCATIPYSGPEEQPIGDDGVLPDSRTNSALETESRSDAIDRLRQLLDPSGIL